MKSPKLIFALSLTSLALGATLYAEDTELPERAARTIASRFPGAKVVEVEVEAPGLYEVELSKDGEEIEALVSSRGVIFEVERPASLPALPARLARAIRSAAGTSPIEELSRKERCAEVRAVKLAKPRRVFEVVVEQGGRIGVVEITADGEVVEKLRWKAMRTPRRKDDDQGRDDDDDDGEEEDDDDDGEDEDDDDGDEDDDDGDGDEDGDEDDDDDEDKRRLIRLPEPCRARLRQAFAGAKLLAVEVELEEGLLVFEAKLRRKGKAFSVAMDRKGTVLETEAKVDRTELTRAAAAKLKELAPGAAIVEVEEERILAEVKTRIFEQAKVFYEVETEGREFLIDARGKLVTSDDEGEQNDDDDDDDDDDDSEDDDDDR